MPRFLIERASMTLLMTNALDPAQLSAATGSGRYQLVLAGPGSGKTTTLAGRFVHLVQNGADRRRILALTFTKKAADEMKARIIAALRLPSARDLNIATFHGFTFRRLRHNPQIAGLSEDFQLWDTPEQRHIFSSRQMWWNEEVDILDIIAGAKERLLDATSFGATIDKSDEVLAGAVEFFRVYESALKQAGAIDFADMVPLVVRAMDRNPGYAARITGAFDHVLVDEYQDINPAQIELIDRFTKARANLWAVGDDDQTLYAFRAADVRFILDFPHKYHAAQVHVLDRNYRSAASIVAAAKRLIANNRFRRQKEYSAVMAETGEIVIRGYSTAEVEARQVAAAVAHLINAGHLPREISVLYRTGAVGLPLQPALRDLEIPYEVRGAGDPWQGPAAKLVIGSLCYLSDGGSVEAMSRMGSSKRAEIARTKLDQLRGSKTLDFPACCRLVRDIAAAAVPSRSSDRDRAEWTSVVDAVISVASSCQSLDEFVSRLAEQSATLRKAPENAVVLSTIHSAKGLEWDVVFMIGVEDGVLPHPNNDDVEEERRVAYVGLTRAKRRLGFTYAHLRFGQGAAPSQFLYEVCGRHKRHCVWTDAPDDLLPLVTEREQERLKNSTQIAHFEDDSAGPTAVRKTRGKHGRVETVDKKADKELAQMRRNKANGIPLRHGVAWSAEEDARLRTSFEAGEAISTIAGAHERKPNAIAARLIKLGLIMEEGVVLRPPLRR
jgi:DNA helicase II / ATP-dependent DNA helicase PcrA